VRRKSTKALGDIWNAGAYVGEEPMEDDKQLRRLYDYTKFHIGIYLGAASGLVALISTASRDGTSGSYIASLVGCPKSLAVSFVLMFLAGVAGAVVATSTI
jgi:hypothetical protein